LEREYQEAQEINEEI